MRGTGLFFYPSGSGSGAAAPGCSTGASAVAAGAAPAGPRRCLLLAAGAPCCPAPAHSSAAQRWRRQRGFGGTGSAGLPKRTGSAVAVSAPRAPAAAGAPAAATGGGGKGEQQQQQIGVTVVGVGSRGASALAKLQEHSKVNGASLWCLDTDRGVTDRVLGARALLLPKEGAAAPEQGPLSNDDLLEIVGRGASDAAGRGNVNSGDGGLAFVVAPAAAGPGGPQLLMQLSAALRAAGHFTVVALTNPFGFEGGAKADAAARLAAALSSSAHLVAVMEQEVLMQAFGGSQMTVAEATDIADNALEHTVRAVLQAVQAQEVLKSSRGALMWHGRDMRHFKRLLAPPLQTLLTSAGTAVLGRGLAAMPGQVAHQMGASQALMHLASDAVRAAAESPFLDGALEGAEGVLCCLSLPAPAQAFTEGGGSALPMQVLLSPEGERHAHRMAVQAAAGALSSVTGAGCSEFIVSAEPRAQQAASDKVEVEATLLVLRPAGAASAVRPPPPPPAPSASAAAAAPAAAPGPAQAAPHPGGPQRLPASTWNALSALAGGTTKSNGAAGARQQPAAPPQPPAQQQAAAEGGAGTRAPPSFNFFQGGAPGAQRQAPPPPRQQQPPQPQPAAQQPKQQQQPQQPAQPAAPAQQPQRPPPVPVARSQPPLELAPQQQGAKLSVGDYLADSLTAQSLDLPPAAARWRQARRTKQQGQERPKLIVWEVDQLEPWEAENEEEEGGLAGLLMGHKRERRKVNIRDRMAGILQQDREEAFEDDYLRQEGSKDGTE